MKRSEIIEKIRPLIALYFKPTKFHNTQCNSYSLKHLFERLIKEYVSEQELIEAMHLEGYESRPYKPGAETLYFKVDALSVKRTNRISQGERFRMVGNKWGGYTLKKSNKMELLGKVFFAEFPGLPGFQLAMIVQKHDGDVYRCRVMYEGAPFYFFQEEAELLAADPRPATEFERLAIYPDELEQQKRNAIEAKRRQGPAVFPFRKDSGQVN